MLRRGCPAANHESQEGSGAPLPLHHHHHHPHCTLTYVVAGGNVYTQTALRVPRESAGLHCEDWPRLWLPPLEAEEPRGAKYADVQTGALGPQRFL